MKRAATATALLLVAVIALTTSPVVTAALRPSQNLDLVLVQVVHRHGARTPIAAFNESIVCGQLGCGMLTVQGKEMLTQLGNYVRQNYASVLDFPASYDPLVTVSRSTDIPRTLQSSASFLRGLYPNSSDWYPVIHTKPLYDDKLIVVNAIPAMTVQSNVEQLNLLQDLYDHTSSLFTPAELTQLGDFLSSDAYCSINNSNPIYFANCALYIADIAISLYSQGTLNSACPPCVAKMPAFHEVIGWAGFALYAPNASSPFKVNAGTWGQHLLAKLAENSLAASEAAAAGARNAFAPRLFEYSAHDTTLMPLSATLGFGDLSFYEPRFGQAYVIESYRDRETNATLLAFKYGHPDQAAESNHAYTFAQMTLNCIDRTGRHYFGQICDIDDLRRFAATTAPQSPLGDCYTAPGALAVINCTTLAAPYPTKIEEGGVCAWFREKCPLQGCPAGYYVYPVDKSCAKL